MKNKLLTAEPVFESRWMSLIAKQYADSPQDPYYVVQTSDYVAVLAVTTEQDIILVKQYRPAVEQVTLEFPSGHVDLNESPEKAAVRELREETGYEAPRMELLGVLYPDTGRLGNRMHCYFAAGAVPTGRGVDLAESLKMCLCSKKDLAQKLKTGEFSSALHVSLLALALVSGRIPSKEMI